MVHFQRVFSLVFRFVLTALCLGFSIFVSLVCFLSFKFDMRKVLISIQPKSTSRPPLNHKVNLNQDLRTFLQRPTNTKVVKVWNRNCLCFLGDLICLFITVSYVFLLQRSLSEYWFEVFLADFCAGVSL